MSDIFISYKREDQNEARKLADALEQEGWTVWWDPKLRAGEHFDDVIEEALSVAKCVIVLWSEKSVKSRYVKDEAIYGLEHNKLVPVVIEETTLPFRFAGVHTPRLIRWSGSVDVLEYRNFLKNITAILGLSPNSSQAENENSLKDEEFRKESEEKQELKNTGKCSKQISYDEESKTKNIKFTIMSAVILLVVFGTILFSSFSKTNQSVEKLTTNSETDLPRINTDTVTRSLLTEQPKRREPGTNSFFESLSKEEAAAASEILESIKFTDSTSSNSASLGFRDTLKDGTKGPDMVTIHPDPQGFMMGSGADDTEAYADERPRHKVVIAKPFAIGKYEVTFEEYNAFANATGKKLPEDEGWRRGQRPVINVSWEDVRDYAKWLSEQTGKHYRLPSEAEWEYAARSGEKEEKWAGTSAESQLGDYAWYSDNSDEKTHPTGEKTPNGLGLYDMSGNVWEWVEDCWNKNYESAPGDGSAWTSGDCGLRVIRGGSWDGKPGGVRSAYRSRSYPGYRGDGVGFRLAQDL